jgi:hypothetical protein
MFARTSRRCSALGLLLLFGATAFAEVYRVGDSFDGFKAVDQHGKDFAFKPGDARWILFEDAGEVGDPGAPKDPDWFNQNRALVLINVTELSAFRRRIANSRMEAKPFRILVVSEADVAARFPREKAKFTVLRLDEEGRVAEIRFSAPGKELQALLAGGKTP